MNELKVLIRRHIASPWLFLALVAPVLSLMLIASARFDFGDPDVEDVVYSIRPQHPTLTTAKLTLSEAWTVDESGARADADARPTVELELEPGPWVVMTLMINGSVDPPWVVRVGREFESRTTLGLQPGKEWRSEATELPAPFSDAPFKLTLSPQATAGEVHLSRIGVHLSARTSQDRPVPLPGAVVGGFLPLAFAAFLFAAGRRTEKQALLLGGMGGAVALGVALLDTRAFEFLWAGTTAFALGTAAGGFLKTVSGDLDEAAKRRRRLIAELGAGAGILCIAVYTKWQAFVPGWSVPLLPDALGYLQIAYGGGGWFETVQAHAPWVREPLFPALLRVGAFVLPETATSARFVSLLIGVLPVALSWLVGRRIFGPAVALAAAMMMAANPFLADVSIRVLRDDLVAALFLALLGVVAWCGEWRWWRAVLFGVAAAALILTRLPMLALLVPLLALTAWRGRWDIREVVLAFALAVVPVLPHLAFNARYSDGDALYSSNVHTRYYLNRAMIGEEGFPATVEQWTADPYAGEVVGAATLVRHLGPVETLVGTARGFVIIFIWEFPYEHLFQGKKWLMLPGLLGAWVWWQRRRELWWVAVWFVLFMAPLALVASIGLDRRLAIPAVPVIYWTWAAGIEWIAVQGRALLLSRMNRNQP